jgi:hypothetical protein
MYLGLVQNIVLTYGPIVSRVKMSGPSVEYNVDI